MEKQRKKNLRRNFILNLMRRRKRKKKMRRIPLVAAVTVRVGLDVRVETQAAAARTAVRTPPVDKTARPEARQKQNTRGWPRRTPKPRGKVPQKTGRRKMENLRPRSRPVRSPVPQKKVLQSQSQSQSQALTVSLHPEKQLRQKKENPSKKDILPPKMFSFSIWMTLTQYPPQLPFLHQPFLQA